MKIKNIVLSLCVVWSIFSFVPSICSAITAKEKYSGCFREFTPGIVSVQNLAEEDKGELARMLSEKDDDLIKYLGDDCGHIDLDIMLSDSSDVKLKLTVRDAGGRIVGLIKLSNADGVDDFWVTYWIGKEYRGKGYMSSAMTAVMSKIWGVDSAAKFYFSIDDENIASQRTLRKICKDLNANLKICDKRKSEMQVYKIDDLHYFMQMFENDEEIFSCCVHEDDEMLKTFLGKSHVLTMVTEYLVTQRTSTDIEQ